MQVNLITNYSYNINLRKNTGYTAKPQISFRRLKGGCVQLGKNFEKLSVKEQRNHLFETLKKILKKMYKDRDLPEDAIKVLGNTDENNVKYKLEIFDLMQEAEPETDDYIDILECTNDKNYSLVKSLFNDGDFPWDYISNVAKNIEAKDCKPIFGIYKLLTKHDFSEINCDAWDLIRDIMCQTNSQNFDLAKVLVEDRGNIILAEKTPEILKKSQTKEQTDTKLYAYNILKDREDIKLCWDSFANILKNVDFHNIAVFDTLIADSKFSIVNIANILDFKINSEKEKSLLLRLVNEEGEMTGDEVEEIINTIFGYNLKLAEKVCFESDFSTREKTAFLNSTYITNSYENSFAYCGFLDKLDLNKLHDNYKKIHQTVINNPEMYINGDGNDYKEMVGIVDAFFERNMACIMGASHIFDMKTMDDLLRMRLDYTEDYLEELAQTDLKFLKSLCDSKNVDGKPLSSKQKIEMLDIVKAYNDTYMDTTKLENMAEKGVVDIYELNSDLLKKVFSDMGINISVIPKEKLTCWNLKYIHLLAKEIEDSDWEQEELFKAVINAANSKTSFKDFIQDPKNEYGYNNKATMLDFKEMKMNYDKWVNQDKENNVLFVYKDENNERLFQISNQIEEDMNVLLHTDVREFVKKQFPHYIKVAGKYYNQTDPYSDNLTNVDLCFEIPDDYKISQSKLKRLVNMLADKSKGGQLSAVWNRAKKSLENPEKQEKAKKTLMVLNHLEQRVKDIETAGRVRNGNLDLTIKMWDRIPQHDLFQGNYSTCCIGMNACNGWSMPVYLLNTAFNMIELVDNATGETIGNALCYFVKDVNNNPVFIIDNIEIKNRAKPSDKVGLKLRDAITEYAKNITRDVTGKEDIPILLGKSFNDVPYKDLPEIGLHLMTLGRLENDIYIDAIDYERDVIEKLYQLAP